MYDSDEEEELRYETIGRSRRPGDESPSPSRSPTRFARTNEPILAEPSRAHDNASISGSSSAGSPGPITPSEQPSERAEGAAGQVYPPDPEQHSKGRQQSTGFYVKTPADDEDLTPEEFRLYQAQYGTHHYTATRQYRKGTADEDSVNPTLGNRRSREKIADDGSIDERDFGLDRGLPELSQPESMDQTDDIAVESDEEDQVPHVSQSGDQKYDIAVESDEEGPSES